MASAFTPIQSLSKSSLSQVLSTSTLQNLSKPTHSQDLPISTTPQNLQDSRDSPISTPPQAAQNSQDLSTLWWNTNLSPSQYTSYCPSYLQYALSHPKERANLSTPDRDFQRLSWDQVRNLVASNRLDLFTRLPSELRRYRQFTESLAREWGSVARFIKEARLGWTEDGDAVKVGRGFEEPDNLKILPNDWPYAFDPNIAHLVVWTKFNLPSYPATDDLTPSSRAVIDAYVSRTFRDVCGKDNVLWFRNWGALKSVHAVEHFHVLVYNPPESFVMNITGGDIGLSLRSRAESILR